MATFSFYNGKKHLTRDLINKTVKIMLLKQTVEPSHTLTNLVGLQESTAIGYSRKTLTVGAIVEDQANNKFSIDYDNVFWNNLKTVSEQITGIIFYVDVDGTDANAEPIIFTNDGGYPLTLNGTFHEINIANLFTFADGKRKERIEIYDNTSLTDAEKIIELKTLDGIE